MRKRKNAIFKTPLGTEKQNLINVPSEIRACPLEKFLEFDDCASTLIQEFRVHYYWSMANSLIMNAASIPKVPRTEWLQP